MNQSPDNQRPFRPFRRFPFYRQLDAMDCGPACLRMIAAHYGRRYSLQYLREACYIDREGVSLKGIGEAAERIGLRTLAVKVPFGGPKDSPCLLAANFPVIAHWNQNHFLVVVKANRRRVWVADPGAGQFRLRRREFERHWRSDGNRGVLLLLEPGLAFYQEEDHKGRTGGFSFLAPYLTPHRRLFGQLLLGLLAGSVFSLILPFLTQAIVDVGIQNRNIGFIYLVLFGQLALFAGQTVVRFLQNWILLHIGVRMNVSLISENPGQIVSRADERPGPFAVPGCRGSVDPSDQGHSDHRHRGQSGRRRPNAPEFLFFDQATNALDANNERVIMENLNRYFEGRTVIVVAHRLSTVKNADQIVVMDQGKIMEVGTHLELVRQQGRYYTLVKNQLELGS